MRKPIPRTAPLALAAVAVLTAGCTVAPPAGAPKPAESPGSVPTPSITLPSASMDPSATDTPAEAQASPTLGATLSAAPAPTTGEPSAFDPTVTPTPSGEPTLPDASGAPTAVPSGTGAPALVNVGPGQTVTLGIQNAFNADGWASGIYQPAASIAQTQALAATVNCGQPAPALEFRFAPTRGTLKVNVAQDVMSTSSDNTVEFVVYADGKAVGQKAVTFKQAAELSAPLAGVTVVKIVPKTTGTCSTSSTALITKAVVTG